jgi:hypothetical protein
MREARSRRFELLDRLNAHDSGTNEDERRAARESERCTELLIAANRWLSTWYLGRIVLGVCSQVSPTSSPSTNMKPNLLSDCYLAVAVL